MAGALAKRAAGGVASPALSEVGVRRL